MKLATIYLLLSACGSEAPAPPPAAPAAPAASVQAAASTPTPPAAATPDCGEDCIDLGATHNGWMVIVGGSRDRDEALALQHSYRDLGAPSHMDYPQLVNSSGVQGLNPGFWIVVAATPADEAVALAVRDRLRHLDLDGLDTSGTYVRPVQVAQPESLELSTLFPSAWRALVIWQTTTETSEDWGWFTSDVQAAAQAAGILVLAGGDAVKLPVVVDGRTMTTLDLGDYRTEPLGYIFVMEGQEPAWQAHAMTGEVLSAASGYFGVQLNGG